MSIRSGLASVRRHVRQGMTLIELTVVIAVLAILAAALVPRLAFIRSMSLHANSATAIQDVMQNMLTFHATQARWPHRFDSLLTSTGVGVAPTGLYGSGSGANYGLDSTLSGGLLTKTTLTANQLKSLSGLLGNPNAGTTILEVMDHNESATQPGNSGDYARNLMATGADLSVATVVSTHNVNPSDPNSASGSIIYDTVFPNGNANNEILVALGVGPACTAVSKTIVTPPQLYLKDSTRYNRTIVLIRVRSDGVQASLAGAMSPDGRTLDQCLGNYRVTAER